MFFEPSIRRFGLLLLLGVGVMACGHKAPPFPPPLENPARTADLSVQQRSQAAILSFTYPQTTVSGGLLEELQKVEVWQTKKAVSELFGQDEASAVDKEEAAPETETGEASSEAPEPEEAGAEPISEGEGESEGEEEGEGEPVQDDEGEVEADLDSEVPQQPLEVLAAADPAEFIATAKLVDTMNVAAIEQATDGDKLTFRVELDEAGHEEWAHTFAVRTYASDKLVSAFSNLVTLVQRVPPPPPTDFQLAAESDGIKLTWAETAESEEEPAAFRVYRRAAQSRLYGQPLSRIPGNSTEYMDRTATFGERYIYAVTAVGHENPIVESFFGGEREIEYSDRFAPAPPTNLIALAETGRVRLLWDASTEDDVVGYIVFRRQAGAEFRTLTGEPILDVEYSDRTVEVGTTYDYRVSAVDRVGNRGEPSASVVARIP